MINKEGIYRVVYEWHCVSGFPCGYKSLSFLPQGLTNKSEKQIISFEFIGTTYVSLCEGFEVVILQKNSFQSKNNS